MQIKLSTVQVIWRTRRRWVTHCSLVKYTSDIFSLAGFVYLFPSQCSSISSHRTLDCMYLFYLVPVLITALCCWDTLINPSLDRTIWSLSTAKNQLIAHSSYYPLVHHHSGIEFTWRPRKLKHPNKQINRGRSSCLKMRFLFQDKRFLFHFQVE